MTNEELVILIPAYNEGPRIGSVLDVVCSYKREKRIIVIDDGSNDDTAKCAQQYPVELLQHTQNRGKGAALQTAIDYVKHASYWLFLDADLINLRHEHMDALLEPLRIDPKIGMTIGMFQKGGKLSVDLAQRFFAILNGQRGLSGKFVETLPNLSWTRFGVEIFLSRVAQHQGVPIAMPILRGITHHTKESKLGFVPGFRYRLQMYRECIYALMNWHRFIPLPSNTEVCSNNNKVEFEEKR
ncbi:MAG: glycosyltransferase family 2 protein [Firmicutes bacterium]|nr:glycosyltransferase family 2 protein [Bacillota bacterium]